MHYLPFIKKALTELDSKKLINIFSSMAFFYDEPKNYSYIAVLNYLKKYSDGTKLIKSDIGAGGYSFFSREAALIKLVGECIERLCQFYYKKNKIVYYSSFNNLKKKNEDILDPYLFKQDSPAVRNETFGWVKGTNITKNVPALIPAQLAFLSYHNIEKEIVLTPVISTGAAGGFDHISTLLRAIYEDVERDAFMTIYLNKISIPQIDLTTIKNIKIIKIIDNIERYNLKLHLFDITNDLKIPTYLSILLDKTGIGPAISIGKKTNMNAHTAIIASIEEACMVRNFIKFKIIKNEYNGLTLTPSQVINVLQRSLFWASTKMIHHLDFLLKQKAVELKITKYEENPTKELTTVMNNIANCGFEIYMVNLTNEIFYKLNYLVYKVIIPGLQPLFLDERAKDIKIERLKMVSKFFGKTKFLINHIPHPFL